MLIANFGSGKRDQNAAQIEQLWPHSTVVTIDSDPASDADNDNDLRTLVYGDDFFDGGLCSHVLEHFSEADIPVVLKELRRVLKPGAKLVIVVPDLLQVCRLVAMGRLMEVAYQSPAGPIRPADVLFGLQREVAEHPLMGHRFGFDAASLLGFLRAAGFDAKVQAGTLHLIGEGIKVDRAINALTGPDREGARRADRGIGAGPLPVSGVGALWRPGMPLVDRPTQPVPGPRR